MISSLCIVRYTRDGEKTGLFTKSESHNDKNCLCRVLGTFKIVLQLANHWIQLNRSNASFASQGRFLFEQKLCLIPVQVN